MNRLLELGDGYYDGYGLGDLLALRCISKNRSIWFGVFKNLFSNIFSFQPCLRRNTALFPAPVIERLARLAANSLEGAEFHMS